MSYPDGTGGQGTGGGTTGGGQTTGEGQTAPPATPTTTQTPPATTPPSTTTSATPGQVPAPQPQGKDALKPGELQVFGVSFFRAARDLIQLRRQGAAPGATGDPLKTVVGPLDMIGGGVTMPSPERYQLGPGDTITVRYQSPTQAPTSTDITVDSQGRIPVPVSGEIIVVRGKTVSDVEGTLRTAVRSALRDATVQVEMKELRSIGVQVLGEAYQPGNFLMPSTVTLFNALYAAGGPSDIGSLRAIQLKRSNGTTRTFDLYRLFINADGSQDVPLQPGDVIFIPPAKTMVTVKGEVVRPAIYELKDGERLRDAVRYAGGAKPSGIAQKVSVESVRPGNERTLIDANLLNGSSANNPIVYNGDTVEVFSIRQDLNNAVTIDGSVQTPRTYALRDGMRVKDLIESARGLLEEAYPDRADLFRMNPDGTQKLIRIDLKAALKGVPSANVELQANDTLRIYSFNSVMYLGNRRVSVQGAVQQPGDLYRADGMTVKDALLQAGGLNAEAYRQVAYLQRTNPDGTPGELKSLNLVKLLGEGHSDDVVLQDLDVLTVQTVKQATFTGDQVVEIDGAVQRPGTFTRFTNMHVRDLIGMAGNPLPNASYEKIYLSRTNLDGTPGPIVVLDMKKVLAGDASDNVELQPRDKLTIFTLDQVTAKPEERVEVAGAVQRPGSFQRNSNMRVRDLIELAGGPTTDAFLDRAFLQRTNPDGTQGPLVVVNVQKVLAGDPTDNIELEPHDKLSLFTRVQAEFQVDETVRIEGAVQRAGSYPRSKDMTLRQLISLAGGILPTTSETVEISNAYVPKGTPFQRVPVVAVIQGSQDVPLKPGDVVTIPLRSDIQDRPKVVQILGAVAFPGPYMLNGKTDRISNLVNRAGGFTEKAFPQGTEFVRDPKYLITPNQQKMAPKVIDTFRTIAEDDYKRASAQVDMDRLSLVFKQGANIGVGSSLAAATGLSTSSATQTVNVGKSLDQALAEALRSEAATKARPITDRELLPTGNVNVNVVAAVSRPNGRDDVQLEDGDIIVIPERPTAVTISGAVVVPTSVVFEPGRDARYYIERAGGLTSDADPKEIIIVRATGGLIHWKPGVRIEVGDYIVIPTKMMSIRLKERESDLQQTTNALTSAGITLALIKAITK